MSLFKKQDQLVKTLNLHDFEFADLPYSPHLARVATIVDDAYEKGMTAVPSTEEFAEKLMETCRTLFPEQVFKIWKDPEGVIETGIETQHIYYPVGKTLRKLARLRNSFDRKMILFNQIIQMQEDSSEVDWRTENYTWFASDNTELCDCCDNNWVEIPITDRLVKTFAVDNFAGMYLISEGNLREHHTTAEELANYAQENTRMRLAKEICIVRRPSGLYSISTDALYAAQFILFDEYMNILADVVGGPFAFAYSLPDAFYFAGEKDRKARKELQTLVDSTNRDLRNKQFAHPNYIFRWKENKITNLTHRR